MLKVRLPNTPYCRPYLTLPYISATENDSQAGVVQTASPCCLGPKVRRGLLRRHGSSISTDRFCCDAMT